MWGPGGHHKNNAVKRHPSALESKGFLGVNKRWNPRPASWAAPHDVDVVLPPRMGPRSATMSSVSSVL